MQGVEEDNKLGIALEAFFMNKDFIAVNEGNEHTFVPSKAKSLIDVTVVNMATRQLSITDWHVRMDKSFSDHRYVEITVAGMTQR